MSIPVISPIEIKLSAIPPRLPGPENVIEDAEYTVHDVPPEEMTPSQRESMAWSNKYRSADDWRARLAAKQRQLKGEGEAPENSNDE